MARGLHRTLVSVADPSDVFCVSFCSQREKSVTVDEFVHYPAGLYNLTTQDWRMDRESPPLVKCLPGAVAALLAKPIVPPLPPGVSPNPWDYGYWFMDANFTRYQEIFTWGRAVMIVLSCLGGWLVYLFAARLFGAAGGIVSLLLYTANPNLIAHAQLVTIDAGAMVFFLAAVFLFRRFLDRPTLSAAAAAGLGLGLAVLSKFTALILIPLTLAILRITPVGQGERSTGEGIGGRRIFVQSLGRFCLVLLVCVLTLDAVYFFSGLFETLEGLPLASDVMKALASTPIGRIPLPVPAEYINGFDEQLAIAQGNNPFYGGYLMGDHSPTGWWYYSLIGLLVKNPEILWGFVGMSLWAWARTEPRLSPEDWLCLWGIPAIFLTYISLGTHIAIGIRFLLPVFPLLCVACGAVVRIIPRRGILGRTLLGAMLFLYCLPAASVYPDYLAYFNLASGGPRNGHRWLIDSNLDWGQDLPALKRYMDHHGIPTVKLGYFGRVDPRIYGIDYTLAAREPGPGWHVISVNFLVGRPYYLFAEGKVHTIDADYYAAYRSLTPEAVLGHTLFVFPGDAAVMQRFGPKQHRQDGGS